MKYLKMLGLAALAAGALMAFVGVGTASATTLCENNTTTGCTNHVNSGTSLDFSAEDSTRLLGPFNITIATCTASTVQGTTTSTGSDEKEEKEGANVTGTITALTFSNCGSQTVTANSATLGTLSITHIKGTDNGTVTSNDTTVTITGIPSPFPSTCRFLTSNTDIGTLTGNLTAPTFDIGATIPPEAKSAEEGCPSGTWSGHYIYTGTTPFIVSD